MVLRREILNEFYEQVDKVKYDKAGNAKIYDWFKTQFDCRISNFSKNQGKLLVIQYLMQDENKKKSISSLNELLNKKNKYTSLVNKKDLSKYKVGDEIIKYSGGHGICGVITKINKASVRFQAYKQGKIEKTQSSNEHYTY